MYKTSLSCLLQIIKSGNLKHSVFVSANLTHKPSSYKWSHAHDLKKVPQGFLSLPRMFRENSFCCLSAQLASLFSGKVNYRAVNMGQSGQQFTDFTGMTRKEIKTPYLLLLSSDCQ